MLAADGPIADAALAALADERAAEAAAEQERRDRMAEQARERLAVVLEAKVDPAVLDVEVHAAELVVLVSDGETTLSVDREQGVRLAEVRDGKPTGLSEPVGSLVELGRVIEKRGRA